MTCDLLSIALIMGEVDADGKVISNSSVNLGPEGYEMVMTGSPDWAKGKPAGEFRRADIFKVMDLLGIE